MAGKTLKLVLTGILAGILGVGVYAWFPGGNTELLSAEVMPFVELQAGSSSTILAPEPLIDTGEQAEAGFEKLSDVLEVAKVEPRDLPSRAGSRTIAVPAPVKPPVKTAAKPVAPQPSNQQPKKQVKAPEKPIASAQAEPVQEPPAAAAGPQADDAEPSNPPAAPSPEENGGKRTVTYIGHTVARGDTIWNIGLQYGVPVPELLSLNNLTERTSLNIGTTLKIPIYMIPVKATPGPQFGELLDWWAEAQYVWPIGKDARVIDFNTGKSFMVRRTIGAFHADVEPLTEADTRIMKEIWGNWSWATRPVIVEVDGRRLAASANGMPHSIQTITNNGFAGHFCIHFQNSTRHKDNLQQKDHQENVRVAAGMQ